MRVYRIEREKYLKSTLSGIGAAQSEGNRWNSLYTSMVYTAESRALANLEVAVHLDLSEDLPTDRHYVEINIPDDIEILELSTKDLPVNWDNKPPINKTRLIGDAFIKSMEAAVLKVPSSIISREYNYLINPMHADAAKIKVMSTQYFTFDSRLKHAE
ncbi:MAG: RES family NAD+ phosphorylase [Cytophagales bacterium]|nr:RES family NAD+ phosphorylase [Cytophagales bacterium]